MNEKEAAAPLPAPLDPAAGVGQPPSPSPKPSPPFPAPWWEIFSWCMFDFANSSFTTVITTVVFAVYFHDVICQSRPNADFLWGLSNTISQWIVLLTAPIIGAIADSSGAKKRFLTIAWLGCCGMTASLWFADAGSIALGMTLYVLANMFYSAGENLTASFLPELVEPGRMGKVSGYGWAWGYVGGLCCLVACVAILPGDKSPDFDNRVRLTNVLVAGFFLVAASPTILLLRERKGAEPLPPGKGYVRIGFEQVLGTIRQVRRFRELAKFLFVFLVYNCGITIVVSFAAIYAKETLHLKSEERLLFFIVVQVTSAVGAFAFGIVQDRLGARFTINATLLIWVGVCMACYFASSKTGFYLAGNLAGLAIGASQSGGRALVGVFSPPSRSAEFFGFWALFWKMSSSIGPLTFGAASWIAETHGAAEPQRLAILVTAVYFVAGFIGMFFIDEQAGRQAALEAERTYAPGNA